MSPGRPNFRASHFGDLSEAGLPRHAVRLAQSFTVAQRVCMVTWCGLRGTSWYHQCPESDLRTLFADRDRKLK